MVYRLDDVHVRKLVPVFEGRFAKLADHPLAGEVRCKGMIGAVELVADKATKRAFDPKSMVGLKAVENSQKHGLINRMLGDAVALCPPLTISESEMHEMFDRLERAIDDTEAWVEKEGLRAA